MESCFGNLSHSLLRISSSNGSFIAQENFSVIQDLDIYFVRQIAHSLREYDLEQKIDIETKIREGSAKLLAACKHTTQNLEAAKSLLVSNERMTAYVSELQYRKTSSVGADNRKLTAGRANLSKAKIAVSDIRMPLMWKDTDHFQNKGDYRRFAVFCLLKIGSDIFDTFMVNDIDRTITDIPFDDVIVFPSVSFGFELTLEVYSHIFNDDLSIASTPRKIKERISNSISRTIGRKLAASLKEEINSHTGPKFNLVAHATLKLEDASNDIHTHDLVLENLENPRNQLPLFGHFCCRFAVQPECVITEKLSGNLSFFQVASGILQSRQVWCIIKRSFIHVWIKQEDSSICPPFLLVHVNKNSKLETDHYTSKYHRCFKIVNHISGKIVEHTFGTESNSELTKWISSIKEHIEDQVIWGHASDHVMEIPSPESVKTPSFQRSRQGSLYEDTRCTKSSWSSLSTSSSMGLYWSATHSRRSSQSSAP